MANKIIKSGMTEKIQLNLKIYRQSYLKTVYNVVSLHN